MLQFRTLTTLGQRLMAVNSELIVLGKLNMAGDICTVIILIHLLVN